MAQKAAQGEVQPLLAGQRGPDYATQDAVDEPKKKHFNMVGLSPSAFWGLMLSTYFGILIVTIDSSIVTTLLSAISSEFYAANQAQWLGTSYLLAQSCASPMGGRLMVIFGRRQIFVTGVAIFACGTLGCGLATSMGTMIFARCVAGVGGGIVGPVVSTVSSDAVPLSLRGLFNGLLNVIAMTGVAFGGPVGGLIHGWVGWRWAFLGQLPMFFVIGLAGWYFIRYTPPSPPVKPGQAKPDPAQQTTWSRVKQIDYLGAFILITAELTLLLPISILAQDPDLDLAKDWKQPWVIGSVVLGLVALATFVFVELKIAKQPIMPMGFFNSRTMSAMALYFFIGGIPTSIIIFSAPLFLIIVKQYTPSQAALRMIPRSLTATIPGILGGLYIRKVGTFKEVIRLGSLFTVVGAYFCTWWNMDASDHIFWWPPAILIFGNGLQITCVAVAVVADLGRENGPFAMTVQNTVRSIGSVVGVTFSGIILQTALRGELENHVTGPDAEKIMRAVRRSSESVRTLPEPQKSQVIEAYNAAFQPSWWTAFAFFVIICIIMQFVKGYNTHEIDKQERERQRQQEEAARDAADPSEGNGHNA